MTPRLLVFAKAPVAGKAKTRLIALLGDRGAAVLARQMLTDTCAAAFASGLSVELCVTPGAADKSWIGLLPDDAVISDQGPGDLGERMGRAAERAVREAGGAVLIGTDCPAMSAERLRTAAAALRHSDAFINPAADGGYVLLAIRRFSPRLFEEIAWSGPDVLASTLQRLDELGWTSEVGETLRDVDEPADVLACFGETTAWRHPR